MKIQNKIALAAAGLLALATSCANHDLIPDMAQVGQAVPTCYWEVGSTTCKAGEEFTFQGKYTVEPDRKPDHSEVWYSIIREDDATATASLAGSSLAYSKSVSSTDTMRTATSIARFEHSLATWDGHEFIIQGTVPVSRTLSPMKWSDISEWNQDRFESYYPQGFAEEFCSDIVNLLTKDSTYYNALRQVYLNYPFTNEQVAAVNAKYGVELPTDIDLDSDDKGLSEKSDLWFATTAPVEADIVGYYYKKAVDGVTVYVNISADDLPVDKNGNKIYVYDGYTVYPVYKSSSWIFCRYDDDLGAIVTTVRADAMKAFKELVQQITFPEWIYGAGDNGNVYHVNFNRKYHLEADFRVYDTDKNEGIAYDRFSISVN